MNCFRTDTARLEHAILSNRVTVDDVLRGYDMRSHAERHIQMDLKH